MGVKVGVGCGVAGTVGWRIGDGVGEAVGVETGVGVGDCGTGTLEALPGFVIFEAFPGFGSPTVHVPFASESSAPFVAPSPSESRRAKTEFHCFPLDLKSRPKGFKLGAWVWHVAQENVFPFGIFETYPEVLQGVQGNKAAKNRVENKNTKHFEAFVMMAISPNVKMRNLKNNLYSFYLVSH